MASPLASRIQRWINNMNWPMTFYLLYVHIGAVIGLVYCFEAKWQTLAFAALLWPISGLGITAGAHRLWSHRSYKANIIVRTLLMLMNSIANQGSLYHWTRDHRVHHKWSEQEEDPHNASRGFFFAHIGWLLQKKDPKVIEAGKKLNFDDLLADPVVCFQKALDPWFQLFMCFVLPSIIPAYYWQENIYTAYFVAGVLRYCLVLHFTWLVNSLAHFIGERPYDPKSNAVENSFVSLLAIGEGWHNWHHKYSYDYAASEFGVGSRFNPTKLFIDSFAKINWVTDRKRALRAWELLKESRLAQD